MKKPDFHILLYLHRKNSSLKKFTAALCMLSFCILFSVKASGTQSSQSSQAMQEDIATQIIRFHVIANSDTSEDQALKLKVKSAVTESLEKDLSEITDVRQARLVIQKKLNDIEMLAENVIQENGYSYPVTASLEKAYFPLKVYGDLTLPPGQYEALRIEIGKAKGQNWWCIMFPPLCFVDATYSVVPKESKEKLKNALTQEEYDAVFSKEKPDIRIRLKIVDLIKDYLAKES